MTSEIISGDQIPDDAYRVPKGGFGPVYHGAQRVKHSFRGYVERGTVFHEGGPSERAAPHPLESNVVHLGTRAAAHARLEDLSIGPRADLNRSGAGGGELRHADDAIMYEATIRTGSTVGPLVHDYTANRVTGGTEQEYPPKTADLEKHTLEELGSYDVLPYINAVEDVGSLSYAVKPHALRNVRPDKTALTQNVGTLGLIRESRSSPELTRPEQRRPSRQRFFDQHGRIYDAEGKEVDWTEDDERNHP